VKDPRRQAAASDHARDAAAGIVEALQPERVVLFGSMAGGHAGPDSDLDLLVVLDTREPLPDATIRVRRAARARCRGIAMDVVVYAPQDYRDALARGHPLLRAIEREGIVLYAK
jgi:predicted nucleotidyltransferase